MAEGFLPLCREDMKKLNISQMDFVYVSGDAYVDHPSFGAAIITRVLSARGSKVGSPGLVFLCQREIWILWSTIIPYRKSGGGRMPIPREGLWEGGPIMRQWSMET